MRRLPGERFLLTDDETFARIASLAYALLAAALALVVFVLLVRRYRAATPPLRRVLGPVYLFTLEALAALIAAGLVSTVSDAAAVWLERLALISLALMPLAFLAGVLRTHLARAGIADLATAIGNGTPLRDALEHALGDPSLELAYWSDQRDAWVDDEGRPLSDPIAQSANAATFVEHGGARVAALLHDQTLTEQRELVDAVAATAGLGFEKERLQAELRAQYRVLETVIDTAPSLLVGRRPRRPDTKPQLGRRGSERARPRGGARGQALLGGVHRSRRASAGDRALSRRSARPSRR